MSMALTLSDFLKKTLWLTLGVSAAMAALALASSAAREQAVFMAVTVLFFVLLSVGLYAAGVSAARSANRYAFTNLISLSVFGKMALSLGFLLAYREIAQPSDNWFVGIFLLAYAAYTVFEVWFMSKLARLR